MKSIFRIIVMSALSVGGGITAALKAQDGEMAVRTDLIYASSYVFRGVERANASAQATAELNAGDFRAGLWTSQPFDRDETSELNLSAAYTWHATEVVALEFSAAHGWFNQATGGGVARSFETGVTATFAPIAGFTPSAGYFRDFRFRADTTQVALARSIALTKLGTFLDLNFFAGWSAGKNWRPDATGLDSRRDGYGYWGGEVQLPYRISRLTTVLLGLHYADTFERWAPNGAFGGASRGNLWVTFGVNLDF